MSLTRKFHSVNSNRVFLQECLRTDLIPRSFEISNLPQNHFSRFFAKWSHTKKQTSERKKLTFLVIINHQNSLKCFVMQLNQKS